MDKKTQHMLVFTTKQTLNERFTPKNERSVFILNNGDSSKLKDNNYSPTLNSNDKRNILISDEMETDELCSTFNESNVEESEEKANVSENLPASIEQDDLKPINLKSRYFSESCTNLINLTGCNRIWSDLCPVNKRFFPSESRSKCFNSRIPYRGVWKNYRTNKRFRVYNDRCKRTNFPNFRESRRYRYVRPYSHRWGRRRRTLITKEQLDDEIDKYMADVLLHPVYINTDKADANENYLNETEKFLEACEDQ